jgi:hypothetical protein
MPVAIHKDVVDKPNALTQGEGSLGVESRLMGVKLDMIENSMRGYVGRRGQELGAP